MPDVLHFVARHVSRRLVLHKRVKRLAVVGVLTRAVIALDDTPLAIGRGTRRRHHRWPVFRTVVVAHRLAARVLVERVQGHAFVVDHHAVFHHRRIGGKGQCRQR
ncbi:hypothetical protein D3C84_1011230 [compost metagenome]